MSTEKTVSEAIQYRRSVRVYDAEKPIDTAIVKKCIEPVSYTHLTLPTKA